MLIKELKKELEKYSPAQKEKLLLEIYKTLPKKVIEKYEIDNFIKNLNETTEKKKEIFLNIDELEKEVYSFLSDVKNDLYCLPNKIIKNEDRSKWRFKVKKYIKFIKNTDPVSIEGVRATECLIDLYKIMSRGSNYAYFVSYNTFQGIGIEQRDYLQMIYERLFKTKNENTIKKCIELLKEEDDPYGWGDLYLVLEKFLTNKSDQRKAIELLKEEVKNLEEKIKEIVKKDKYKSVYYEEEQANNFIECILDLSVFVGDIEDGLDFFYKHYKKSEKEILMYCLLEKLESLELYEIWIREYEKNKLDYRESLQKKYEKLKKLR